jgi:HEXXH motif-containing protein
MPHTLPSDLKERIIIALTDHDSELWFPHLTHDLMQTGLQKLYEESGLTEENYGTARVILKDADAQRVFERSVFTRASLGEIRNETFVEMLPANIIEQYKESGVDFYTREELRINTEIMDCLRDAFEIIRYLSSLFSSVRYLVKSIHLIKPEDDEYDVSFSEPHIPFSIFVSIPKKNTSINALRVAEAIVHEAMHLQLTLIESITILVVSGSQVVYSPWKNDYRTPQGVIHALYVFRVIIYYFKEIIENDSLVLETREYVKERSEEISSQINEIHNFQSCPNLTYLGQVFTKKLMKLDYEL